MQAMVRNLGLVHVRPFLPYHLGHHDRAFRLQPVPAPVTAIEIRTCPLSERPAARLSRVRWGVSLFDVPLDPFPHQTRQTSYPNTPYLGKGSGLCGNDSPGHCSRGSTAVLRLRSDGRKDDNARAFLCNVCIVRRRRRIVSDRTRIRGDL